MQIRRWARGRVGSREGWHDLEVFRVEGVARDKRYRVRLWRRPEELVP